MHLIPQNTPLWLAQDEDGATVAGRIIGWQVGDPWTPIVSFVSEDGRMLEVGYPDRDAFIGTTRAEAVEALNAHHGKPGSRPVPVLGTHPTDNRLHELAFDAIRDAMPENTFPKWAARLTADSVTLGTKEDVDLWAADTVEGQMHRRQRVAWVNERLERNKRPVLPSALITQALQAGAVAVAAYMEVKGK